MMRRILVLVFVFASLSVSLGHAEELSEKTREEQLVDRLIDRDNYKKYHDESLFQLFRLGDEMIPVLYSRLKEAIKQGDGWDVGVISETLMYFEDGGSTELMDLLFDRSDVTMLARLKVCLHVVNLTDPRCKDYVEIEKELPIPRQGFNRAFIPKVLAGQSEYLPYLQFWQDQLVMASPEHAPYPQRDFDKAFLQYEGAMDWLNRGGPEFTQPPEMPDEEAIRELVLEFMATFERLTPWMVLENTEKGKPVKPGHQVSYYQRDVEARPGSHESYFPIHRVVDKIWETEKKLPIDLTFGEVALNPDRTRALVLIKYKYFDDLRIDGYTFLFWKIEGQWQFRLAEGYNVMIV